MRLVAGVRKMGEKEEEEEAAGQGNWRDEGGGRKLPVKHWDSSI